MNLENLTQIGIAGTIAIYLVVFLVRDQKQANKAILDVLDKIVKALKVK
jgi:hypothetical protein